MDGRTGLDQIATVGRGERREGEQVERSVRHDEDPIDARQRCRQRIPYALADRSAAGFQRRFRTRRQGAGGGEVSDHVAAPAIDEPIEAGRVTQVDDHGIRFFRARNQREVTGSGSRPAHRARGLARSLRGHGPCVANIGHHRARSGQRGRDVPEADVSPITLVSEAGTLLGEGRLGRVPFPPRTGQGCGVDLRARPVEAPDHQAGKPLCRRDARLEQRAQRGAGARREELPARTHLIENHRPAADDGVEGFARRAAGRQRGQRDIERFRPRRRERQRLSFRKRRQREPKMFALDGFGPQRHRRRVIGLLQRSQGARQPRQRFSDAMVALAEELESDLQGAVERGAGPQVVPARRIDPRPHEQRLGQTFELLRRDPRLDGLVGRDDRSIDLAQTGQTSCQRRQRSRDPRMVSAHRLPTDAQGAIEEPHRLRMPAKTHRRLCPANQGPRDVRMLGTEAARPVCFRLSVQASRFAKIAEGQADVRQIEHRRGHERVRRAQPTLVDRQRPAQGQARLAIVALVGQREREVVPLSGDQRMVRPERGFGDFESALSCDPRLGQGAELNQRIGETAQRCGQPRVARSEGGLSSADGASGLCRRVLELAVEPRLIRRHGEHIHGRTRLDGATLEQADGASDVGLGEGISPATLMQLGAEGQRSGELGVGAVLSDGECRVNRLDRRGLLEPEQAPRQALEIGGHLSRVWSEGARIQHARGREMASGFAVMSGLEHRQPDQPEAGGGTRSGGRRRAVGKELAREFQRPGFGRPTVAKQRLDVELVRSEPVAVR